MEKREIVNELVADHWEIRDLLKELRDDSVHANRRRFLAKRLQTWMKWHTLGEDKTINPFGLHHASTMASAYGDKEEHALVAGLLEKLSRTRNPHHWAARVHLVTELVEHHLDEEEEEYFPLLRQELSADESERLALEYRDLTKALDPLRAKVPAPGLLGWISGRPDPTAPGPLLL